MPEANLNIKMDNSAFEEPAAELGRILRALAGKIAGGELPPIALLDFNGNKVGTFDIEEHYGKEAQPEACKWCGALQSIPGEQVHTRNCQEA